MDRKEFIKNILLIGGVASTAPNLVFGEIGGHNAYYTESDWTVPYDRDVHLKSLFVNIDGENYYSTFCVNGMEWVQDKEKYYKIAKKKALSTLWDLIKEETGKNIKLVQKGG